MEVGGWVQVSLGFVVVGISSQNCSNPVLIFWSSIPRRPILSVYMLKAVSYYDFSVLSMSVMGFQKIGWGSPVGELYPSLFWIFLTAIRK